MPLCPSCWSLICADDALQNVVRIPWLRHDNLWKAFLRPPSSIAMDLESNNIGYMQLLACLQQMELPQKSSMSAHIEGIKEELSIMEKHGE